MSMISDVPKIHDTTLRDGEQMPGVAFSFLDKIKIAEKIMDFGVGLVDIMPVVSDSEFRVTKELTGMFGKKISVTCRTKKEDVDTAIEAGAERVTLFAPMSDLHIKEKIGIDRDENIRKSLEIIDYSRSNGLIIDFAGEDATRSNFGYFRDFVNSIENRISTFFIADTVGCLTPRSTRNLVTYMKKNFSCDIGLHSHNDFGMATANTIEAALAGADYLSGTFTGIGERAGNAPIEEVCVSLKYLHNIDIGVRFESIKDICDMVQELSGISLQRHKPIVGENAFAHESGIHVDGVLKNPRTYEYFDPEAIGHSRSLVLGKHSGRKGVEHFMLEAMAESKPDMNDIDLILKTIKSMYDKDGPEADGKDVSRLFSAEKRRVRIHA